MAHDISCDVHNCAYNKSTRCHAEEIKVCNSNCHKAEHERQTQCDTFKCK